MAIAVANVGSLPYRIVSGRKKTVTDVTLDNSYPTGGETVTAAQLSLSIIEEATAAIKTVAGTVNITSVFCNIASGGASLLLVAYDETPGEVANAASLDTVVIQVTAFGR